MKYAGIGSRGTPPETLIVMTNIAMNLADKGWILRSGGAPGADQAFWEGARWHHPELVENYLPWDGFEGFKKIEPSHGVALSDPAPEAFKIAEKYHPAWFALSAGGRRLMARNSHQILGRELDDPVDLVLCWTEGGKLKGGTAQALRMAQDLNIPVYNLGDNLTARLLHDIMGA